jgi:diguanylate cyclase (GGDEF)-like protein
VKQTADHQKPYRDGISLSKHSMDMLMPMHVWIDPDGTVRRVGPTLQKALAHNVVGKPFTRVFDVTRPSAFNLEDLFGEKLTRVSLSLRDNPEFALKGDVSVLKGRRGAIFNLSFGISVVDAVRHFDLCAHDFSHADLAVELPYLVEAKSAIHSETRKLNGRLQSAKIDAERQAFTDSLTGLSNRRAMGELLDRLLTRKKQVEEFGVMHIDLDYFKAVNDTLGHAAGDHVLMEVSRILGEVTRQSDLVSRVGGDEFVIIFRACSDLELLSRIARRIITEFEKPMNFGGQVCRISASIGTTISKFYAEPRADQILDDADLATYASKHKGRAQHTIFTKGLRDSAQLSLVT